MKYFVFAIMLVAGVPVMAWYATTSEKARGWLVTLFVFSTALSTTTKINFVSMEHYRGPDRGFEVNLTDLVAWALIIATVSVAPKRVSWVPYNSLWCLALYGLAILSAVGAPDRLVAAFSLFKWARAYVIYWCAVNVVRLGFPDRAVWRGMVGMALYITVLAIRQKYVMHLYRVPGPFDHSNTVPLFLNQFLPVLMIWGICDSRLKGWQSALSVVGVLGLIVASQSTFSRMGTLLSVAVFVLALIVGNVRSGGLRVRMATVVAVILVSIGGAMAAHSIMQRVKDAPESSEEARTEFNLAAGRMAADYVFGVGVNNFPRVLTSQLRYNGYISVMEDEDQAGVCHHIYNLTAAELGKGGLIVFCVILLRFAWIMAIHAFRGKSLEAQLLFGFLFGALALHASGFLEWVFRITPVTFMYAICCGLGVGYCGIVREQIAERARAHAGAPLVPQMAGGAA